MVRGLEATRHVNMRQLGACLLLLSILPLAIVCILSFT